MKIGDKVRVVAVPGDTENQFYLTDTDVSAGIQTGKVYTVTRVGGEEFNPYVYLDRGQDQSEWAMFPEMLELVVE